ncbi:MAG: GntR family transcriptional regulator [Opitutae bacterium]|nr:GntR family transcriptional regulator [Opitutae bacterium]
MSAKASTSSVPRLDRRNPLPLHAQAEQALRTLIQQPDYQAGGLLPDEVSLARLLGISRNTLRAAIARLVSEGRLERTSGVGTRVIEPKVHSGVGAWQSFTREMAAKGIEVETHFVKATMLAAPAAIATALRLDAGSPVLCLDRVRGWDGQPEVHFRSYLHPRLGLTLQEDFTQPLYDLIRQRCSVVADESSEEFTSTVADRQLAKLLKVKTGAALLRRDRVVLDTGRRPIEYAIVHYRCERFRLTLNLRQP